ncbi:MAG: DUF4270 family protein [Cyclobacteriaceae bacterium]
MARRAERFFGSVKSGLVIVLLALILFSCEEPGELGENFVGDRDDISVFFKEFQFDHFQKQNDSLISVFNNRMLTGYYRDPAFGEVYGEGYLDVDRLTSMPNVQEGSILDSVLLTFKIDYLYGTDLNQPLTISIQQLQNSLADFRRDTTIADSILTSIDVIPVVTEQQQVSENILGQFTFTPTSDIIEEDSVIIFKLAGAEFNTIFEKIVAKDSSFVLDDSAFSRTLRGLALVPEKNSSAIIGIDAESEVNNLRLHYHATGDTSTISFPLRNPRYYSYLTAEQSGTPLAGISIDDTISTTNDKMYIQNGIGIVPVIRFNEFKSFFKDSDVIINSAILELKIDDWDGFLTPNSGIFVYVTDSTGKELINIDQNTNSFNPVAINTATGAAGSIFSRSNGGFVNLRENNFYKDIIYIDLTLFMQGLADNSLNNNSDNLMLYPNSYLMFNRSSNARDIYRGLVVNVDRTIIDKSQSKLRVHYTTID